MNVEYIFQRLSITHQRLNTSQSAFNATQSPLTLPRRLLTHLYRPSTLAHCFTIAIEQLSLAL